jgi:cob(I)alamin adenosyltransferase
MSCFQIYTGRGKGKTTAAFGLALRAAGRGKRVFIGQFLKHQASGEALALSGFPGIHCELFGLPRSTCEPFSAKDVAAVATGMDRAREALVSASYDLVILDELVLASARGLVSVDEVLALASSRPGDCELVITGRDASARLVDAADLVTEMRALKHYLDSGLSAREGIEY